MPSASAEGVTCHLPGPCTKITTPAQGVTEFDFVIPGATGDIARGRVLKTIFPDSSTEENEWAANVGGVVAGHGAWNAFLRTFARKVVGTSSSTNPRAYIHTSAIDPNDVLTDLIADAEGDAGLLVDAEAGFFDVRNNPLRLVDPTGMYTTDCAQDDKKCEILLHRCRLHQNVNLVTFGSAGGHLRTILRRPSAASNSHHANRT